MRRTAHWYTVYSLRDSEDFPLCVCATAEEAAQLMGVTLASFYTMVTRQNTPRVPWVIYVYNSPFGDDGPVNVEEEAAEAETGGTIPQSPQSGDSSLCTREPQDGGRGRCGGDGGTIPQSPQSGDSSLCTREPRDAAEAARIP